MREKQLIELHQETGNSGFQVGDLYYGRVQKVMPGLNAAFINVGYEKDGFLHYLDLGPQVKSLMKFIDLIKSGKQKSPMLNHFRLESEIDKGGKVGDVVKQGREILVQVAKEPISTKGPRLTTDLSFAGRYMVLVPFAEKVSISQKITDNDEKRRLKELFNKIKPGNFGLIVRTAAEGKNVEDLESDLKELVKRWVDMIEEVKKAFAPTRVMGELSRTSSIVRDMLSSDFNNIYVDTQEIYQEIHEYLSLSSPEKLKILKLFKGKDPLFEALGLNKQIKASFGKHVTFGSGSYLVIEHTEALHVIDVNSGPRTNSDKDQEANALECNLGAAKEIARQLRLRDMGGIIVIDFIDMRDPKKKNELFTALKAAMKTDRARHTILPMSKFGLVQITRERVRPATEIATQEVCISCNGTGKMDASVQLIDRIENEINYLWENMNQKQVTLRANPLITNYFKHGFPSLRMKWWLKHKHWLKLQADPALALTAYQLENDLKQVVNQEA